MIITVETVTCEHCGKEHIFTPAQIIEVMSETVLCNECGRELDLSDFQYPF